MKKTELTCIVCPVGCAITVTENDDGTLSVAGNGCPRGARYAKQEVTNPVRVVTSVVKVGGGAAPLCSVKTAEAVPKTAVAACIAAIREITVAAPVQIGDTVAEDLAGTGIRLIATANVGKA